MQKSKFKWREFPNELISPPFTRSHTMHGWHEFGDKFEVSPFVRSSERRQLMDLHYQDIKAGLTSSQKLL